MSIKSLLVIIGGILGINGLASAQDILKVHAPDALHDDADVEEMMSSTQI